MVSHRYSGALPAESRAVLDAIRRIVQGLRTSSRAAEQRLRVSGAQLFVLQTLVRQAVWSLNELAERTATHQSSVSVVVDKLVTKKLVQRTRAASDGRKLELSIAPRGRALLAKAPEAAQDRLLHGLARLSPVDRKVLARALTELAEGVFASRERPALFFEDTANPRKQRRGPRNGRKQ
jgi:DNA-binding MarR family transcriptional regulator